jgi:hypothetical protein
MNPLEQRNPIIALEQLSFNGNTKDHFENSMLLKTEYSSLAVTKPRLSYSGEEAIRHHARTIVNQSTIGRNQAALFQELRGVNQLIDPGKMAQQASAGAAKVQATLKQIESAAEVTAATEPLLAKLEVMEAKLAKLEVMEARQLAMEARQKSMEASQCCCVIM